MRPDHPLLDLTVFDSNQLGDPPQRRLHMSSLDNGKRHLLILNANIEELERSLMAAEERRWYQRMRRQGLNAFDPIVRRAVAAVREAAAVWFRQELDDPTSMLANIALTDEQADLTEQLRIALPEQYFRGPDMAQRDVDRFMVAEAAVTSRLLLVSVNKGIRHKELNLWLRRRGWTESSSLIATTDKAHRVFHRLIGSHATYEWMLGAYLPDIPSLENDEDIIRNNIAQIRLAGLEEIANSIARELDSDPDIQGTFARIRRDFPIRTRATEARRLQTVRNAAADAGWGPS